MSLSLEMKGEEVIFQKNRKRTSANRRRTRNTRTGTKQQNHVDHYNQVRVTTQEENIYLYPAADLKGLQGTHAPSPWGPNFL